MSGHGPRLKQDGSRQALPGAPELYYDADVIVVAGTVTIKNAHRDEAVREALRMAAATRLEAGCTSYRFFSDLEDPDTFFVFEEWETADALARHFETAHMQVFRKALPRLLAGGMRVKRYAIESVTPM